MFNELLDRRFGGKLILKNDFHKKQVVPQICPFGTLSRQKAPKNQVFRSRVSVREAFLSICGRLFLDINFWIDL